MAALERHALEAGLERAVLGATGDGRALYERLGWDVGAPLTAVLLPPGLSRREDRAGHLAEGDPAAERARCRRAQGHGVAVLEERAPAAEGAPCRPSSARGTTRAARAASPLMVPLANRSPVRSEAPLTVMWASIWAGDQYIAAYGGRLTTSPLSTTSKSMS